MARTRIQATLVAACLLLAWAERATAEDRPYQRRAVPVWHGPIEIRETWLLAQPRLSLPPTTPDVLPCGRQRWRLEFDRGNDFGWNQTEEGEDPLLRRFMVDGEHQSLALEWRRGMGAGLDVGVRATWQWRGAGFMDDPIDWFHEATGFMDNIRRAFRTNLYRVEGIDHEGRPISWNDERGGGLGALELDARIALPRPPCRGRAALVVRASLPTGTGPFERGGVDVGAQVVGAWVPWSRLRVYAGLGATWVADREIDGLRYARIRPTGFAAVEWRIGPRLRAVVDLVASGKLATNLAGYPSEHVYLDFGIVWDLGRGQALEVLMRENLFDQQSTTDFAVVIAWTLRT